VERIHLAHDRDQWRTLMNTVMKFRVSLKKGNFLTSLVTVSFSRRTLLRGISYIIRSFEDIGVDGRIILKYILGK
jgi:hypothetical protein